LFKQIAKPKRLIFIFSNQSSLCIVIIAGQN
jgi:hypothetical protein